MTTLKIGIASYEEMKARTMRIARGEERPAPDDPKIWFTSIESLARVLSAGNRELLRVIAEKAPGSLDELVVLTGRAKPSLSRTLKAMAGYGFIRFDEGERGELAPRVIADSVEVAMPLISGGQRSEPLRS